MNYPPIIEIFGTMMTKSSSRTSEVEEMAHPTGGLSNCSGGSGMKAKTVRATLEI